MKHSIILLIFVIVLYNCSNDNTNYFNGKVVNIDSILISVDSVSGTKIFLDDNYGYISVYDTLITLSSRSFPNYLLYTYNIDSGKFLGKLLRKGHGPTDFIEFFHTHQYATREEQIRLWGRNAYSDKIQLFNLSLSLEKNQEVFDSILFLDWREKTESPFGNVFILPGDIILAGIETQEINDLEYAPNKYHTYSSLNQELLKSFDIFNRPIINKEKKIPLQNYYASHDRIKPDGTKLVMAMEMMAQINILDIGLGKVKGFRIKDTPDFEYLTKDSKKFKIYNRDVAVDNEYIFVLYSDVFLNYGENYPFETNKINVFDWNGNLLHQLILDNYTTQLAFDPVKKQLYIFDMKDELYRYDLSFLPEYIQTAHSLKM